MIRERWGKTRISQKHYDELWTAISKQYTFIPYKIEYDARDRCFEITGKCLLFQEVAESECLRTYEFIFERLDDGNGTVVLKRVEEL
ncbi:MAG: hypothetical protein KDH96_10905 [Candidatus Riesia sp.]|nr:hypothetical protein [Candidatus Riesia sp.]